MCKQNWAEREFEKICIDDERIVKRLSTTTEILSKNPSASIPEACKKWNVTKATTTFLIIQK